MTAGAQAAPPLVTVGVPLYRSAQFLDIIRSNIDAIDYAHVEILVSDRHLLDDTLDVLRRAYKDDRRFRFLEATDGLNWVEHFNLLLREARGAYVVLMFHDDSYSANYVSSLAAALERHREAVLAFGRVDQQSLDGFLPTLPFTPPPVPQGRPWTTGAAIRTLTTWQLWFAFRGMVRRSVVEERALYIRQTYRNIRADIYWVFALLLGGPLLFVPECSCLKRFYRSSTAAPWRFDLRQSLDACRVIGSYLRDVVPSRREAWLVRCVVYPWCVVQALLPAGAARRLLDRYQRWQARRG